jgi:basic membrane protein A
MAAVADPLNPYIAGSPVTDANMFFGREDIFDWIRHSLAGQYADHILVIHGQRRVGKTSVLKQLPHRLPDRYIPVFFDLQGRTRTTLDRFLWWLAREIVRVLKQDRELVLPLPEQEAFSKDLEYLESHFLPELRRLLPEHTLLLTFDEFDTLEEEEARETLGQPLTETLRRLMGREGLNFIFSIGSSGRKLENMQASYTEFFKAALYKKVSFLAQPEAYHLITRPVEGVLEYQPAAVRAIYEITSGHPYFTQLVCHELFALCQRTGQRTVSAADVSGVLDEVVERGTVNLKFVWDEAAELERWTLAGLAHSGEKLESRALGDFLRKQRVRFSPPDLEAALIHLREKDVLTAQNTFVNQLLRRWLQRNRPLEQVREELTQVNPIANRYIEIGLEYLESGQHEKALQSFQEALEVDSDNLPALVHIGQVHLQQQALAEAVSHFEQALSLDEEDVTARAGLCQAHLALGDQASAKGKVKEAQRSYQQILAVNPEHTDARQRMADMYRQHAEKSLAEGRDDEALASFVEAIGYTPEDQVLETRYQGVREEQKAGILATLRAAAGRQASARNWEQAIRAVEQALELAPEDPGLSELLRQIRASQRADRLQSLPEKARGLAASERWDEAFAAWQDYLSLQPLDPERAQAEIEGLKGEQALAQTYAEAQAALGRKDYDQAISILKGIVARDETYRESTRLLLQAIEARRRARPKWRWSAIHLSRNALLELAAGLAALALGVTVFVTWDQLAGAWIRALGAAVPIAASEVKVCLLTEQDGVSSAYYAPIWGAIAAAQTTQGIEGAYVEGTDGSNVAERIEAFLEEGCDLVVSFWPFAEAMRSAAADHPEAGFLVLDIGFDRETPNLMGIQFKTWEVAFLAGYLAAGVTDTGRVGTLGGMDIQAVTLYMDGFARGVEHYNQAHGAKVVVLGRNPALGTGLFIDTLSDAVAARQASEDLLDQGADVLFPITGLLTTASAEAAQERERAYVIGADLDWATAYPEYADVFLSSAEIGFEEMLAEAIRRLVEGEFPGELLAGNLENGGVRLAPFHELDWEISAQLSAELEALRQAAPGLSVAVASTPSPPPTAMAAAPPPTATAIAAAPAVTATAMPSWVSDFAEPILRAIAARPPDFQDDFDDNSGLWKTLWQESGIKYQDGELVLESVVAYRENIDYPDIVAELDGRFLPDTTIDDAYWGVVIRKVDFGHGYTLRIWYDGQVKLEGPGGGDFPQAANPHFQSNHLLLIAKGSRFAFYVNDQPLTYIEDDTNRWGTIMFELPRGYEYVFGKPVIVALDNFRLWDISDIAIP